MAAEAGFDMKIRVVEFATSLKEAEEGELPGLHAGLVGAHRSRRQHLHLRARARRRRTTAAIPNAEVDKPARRGPHQDAIQRERKAIYEKVAGKFLEDGPLIYLYHRRCLIAHTDAAGGLKQMPDGLVRVVGLKLKSQGQPHCPTRAGSDAFAGRSEPVRTAHQAAQGLPCLP